MTIVRVPVVGVRPSQLVPPLTCRADCRADRESGATGPRFANYRCPGGCNKMSFLYPRLRRNDGTGEWHYHQGIDIPAARGTPIQCVAEGTVVLASNEWQRGFTGYGRIVVIESGSFHYLYAHCDEVLVEPGQSVAQRDIIAKVGKTQFFIDRHTGRIIEHSATIREHLHFEVCNRAYPVGDESTIEHLVARQDPLLRLDRLGPWGPKVFYLPLVPGGGEKTAYALGPESAERAYQATEQTDAGGYFPLGANNIWHGGVHLQASGDAFVRAPFDGKIVAVRLDPDPVHARGVFGSLSFVLMQHELPEHIVEAFRNTRATQRQAWQSAVGEYRGSRRRRRDIPNDRDHVLEVKRMLHQIGVYMPEDEAALEDETVDATLVDAIVAFQGGFSRHPDGVVDIPGTTYHRLQEAAQARQRQDEIEAAAARGEPPPRPNVVYSLFMHLHPETFDDALARRIPWLGRVHVEPTDEERAREEQEEQARQQQIEAEQAEDRPDIGYQLSGSVGPPRRRGRSSPNLGEDVAWVQRRLTRHGVYSGPTDGEWSEALDAAIRTFQSAHVAYYRRRRADAEISATGGTQDTLRLTPTQLAQQEQEDEAEQGSIDQRFIERATDRHSDTGVAKVVTGLEVPIGAGEPVWTAGVGLGFTEVESPPGTCSGVAARGIDRSVTQPCIHWEIFTEEPLVGAWEQIDDDRDDDLACDVPSLIQRAQPEGDPPPHDEAYDPADAAPPEDGGTAQPADDATLGDDDVLSLDEIRRFYASDRSRFLRHTQCRFQSEWALDPSNVVDSLRELGWHTRCLESALAPYMWWSEAGDAVPASPLVWHYNPIAFMQLYLEQFPPPPPPSDAEPEECDELDGAPFSH